MSILPKDKIIIECGSVDDRRILTFYPHPMMRKVAVLVSGGLDSALLYYLFCLWNSRQKDTYSITPYSIIKTTGIAPQSEVIVDYINAQFNIKNSNLVPLRVENITDENSLNMASATILKTTSCNVVYLGLIQNLAEHRKDWPIIDKWVDTEYVKYPLKNLNKSHIIDIIYRLGQEKLFELSHSCVLPSTRCNNCNGCNERSWAFKQLNEVDPALCDIEKTNI